jgi:hypothetical protein
VNTAIILGEANTRRAIYVTIGLAAVFLLTAIVQNAFPLWLGAVLLVSVAISMFFKPKTDMRGSQFVDPSGAIQAQALIIFNLTATTWLATVLIRQVLFLV